MSIDEGSNNFDCHDVDDMRQLLNYFERQLQGNLDATARSNFTLRVRGLKKALKEAS